MWLVNFWLIDLRQYNRKTISRHRQIIRQNLGFTAFGGPGKVIARQEVNQLVSRQIHPNKYSGRCAHFCELIILNRAAGAVPPYFTLGQLISQAISQFEMALDQRLANHLTADQARLLDELFIKLPDDASGRSIHQLARLKNAQELMRLSVVRYNMSLLKDLKALYEIMLRVLRSLNLSPEMVEYYRTGGPAEYVLRADIFHVRRRVRKQLLLLCFVQYHRAAGAVLSR